MPPLLSAATLVVLLILILSNRCSPLVALILVPAVAAVLGGFGVRTATFMVEGIVNIAPVAAMFVFAIVFFGVMTDAGLLEPMVNKVLRLVGEQPERIVIGSAGLAVLAHLDGSGAVCFLIVIPAMLPLYQRLQLDRRVLACVVSMAAGVNFLPWTGPTMRASAALKLPVMEIFRPMLAVQAVGLTFVMITAWWLGRREARRLGLTGQASRQALPVEPNPALTTAGAPILDGITTSGHSLRRPRLFWINLALTLALMTLLVSGALPPAVAFMSGTAIALLLNYPGSAQQRERIDAHARSALMMAAILLAAGAFTGIMTGTGALRGLAQWSVSNMPPALGHHLPFALSLIAMPLSMVFDPDSFYFGIMPVIAEMHASVGGQAVQVAQAALVGQMTAGFPVSPLTPATFLVAGLAGIELSAHQKFTFLFLYAASLVMAVASVLVGLFPI
ncbi:MAG: CitMHS family transporter [Steroidobacteraceae bacterium]